MAGRLGGEAREARITRIKVLADEGHNFHSAARQLGVSAPALWEFTKRHGLVDVRAQFKDNAGPGNGRAGCGDVEMQRRLAEVVKQLAGNVPRGLALTRAAYHLGMAYPALSKWLHDNAPWGAADALADFDDSD